MLFDTHAHYDDESFDADRDAVLTALPEQGVGLILNPTIRLSMPAGRSRQAASFASIIRLNSSLMRSCRPCK